MNFCTHIDNEKVLQLPLFQYNGEVVVVDTVANFNKIKPELFLDKILGFDTETKPTFKKGMANRTPVSLLQLSNASKTYLFRLNKIPLCDELVELLRSPEYTKVGVSIQNDIRSLRKLHPFEPAGFVDLQSVVARFGIKDMSLRKLAAIVLGCRISKAAQLSNWSAKNLTDKQIHYAATDAWISREIFIKLKNQCQ